MKMPQISNGMKRLSMRKDAIKIERFPYAQPDYPYYNGGAAGASKTQPI